MIKKLPICFIFLFYILFGCAYAADYAAQPPGKTLQQLINEEPIGFASVGGRTTGGREGQIVTVNNADDFRRYASAAEPYVILVNGAIFLSQEKNSVASNKTIIGLNSQAKFTGGGLYLSGVSNIVIRNLIFEKCRPDALDIQDSSNHIWIDHCEFYSDKDHGPDFYDGLLDIKRGSDFVTASWNKFHDHYKVSLVGHSDDTVDLDLGHLNVTYHHNWFNNTWERNPSLRFGQGHLFNNYYSNIGGYAINSRAKAQVVAESNYFYHVSTAFVSYTGDGKLTNRNNIFIDTFIGTNMGASSFEPSTVYSYTLDNADQINTIVPAGAGIVEVLVPSPTPTGVCPLKRNGDADCDNEVGLDDFEFWRQEFIFRQGVRSDFNNSGSVTIDDFEFWRRGFLGI